MVLIKMGYFTHLYTLKTLREVFTLQSLNGTSVKTTTVSLKGNREEMWLTCKNFDTGSTTPSVHFSGKELKIQLLTKDFNNQ